MFKIIFGLIIIFILYEGLPNYYYRNMSVKVIKKIDKRGKIALTFDDGPDEVYTPILLDLLKKYEIKATFFVVAEKAKQNKQIFYRIIQEGHSVGLHSLNHRSAWLSFPWTTKRDFINSLKIFKDLGVNIKFFRPPWGTFNLLTQFYADKNRLTTILWTLNARDWSKKTTSEYIKNKILENIKDGDIIVLHDSNGAEGAPLRMIKALENILPKLKRGGYDFVTLDEILGGVEDDKVIFKNV